MATGHLLTPSLRAAFSEEVLALGGTVSDAFEDGTLLLARSVLPWHEEVGPADRVQGGVALRSTERQVFVHPYVFRLVCKNGCIVAHVLDTQEVDLQGSPSAEDAIEEVREAIRVCGSRASFSEVAGRMRTARETQADLALNLLPMLRRLPGDQGAHFLREISLRFLADEDRSRFGLLNAVTSVARDTPDPRLRWRLEEFGGGLLVRSPRAPEFDDSGSRSFAIAGVR